MIVLQEFLDVFNIIHGNSYTRHVQFDTRMILLYFFGVKGTVIQKPPRVLYL